MVDDDTPENLQGKASAVKIGRYCLSFGDAETGKPGGQITIVSTGAETVI